MPEISLVGSTSHERHINAVAEQMSNVSMNTESDCTRPCLTGCDTLALALAFGAEPMPASLE